MVRAGPRHGKARGNVNAAQGGSESRAPRDEAKAFALTGFLADLSSLRGCSTSRGRLSSSRARTPATSLCGTWVWPAPP